VRLTVPIALCLLLAALAAGCGSGAGSSAGTAARPPRAKAGHAHAAAPQAPPDPHEVSRAELLSAREGWAYTASGRLAWTTDAGRHWSPVALPEPVRDRIAGIEFSDAEHGCVAYLVDPAHHPHFQVYATADRGRTWTRTRLPGQTLLAIVGVAFSFATPRHGWAEAGEMEAAGFRGSATVWETRDGGSSWRRLPEPPVGGPIELLRGGEAWLAPSGNEERWLYRTIDDGRSWRKVTVRPPFAVKGAGEVSYGLPTIAPDGSGLLPMLFNHHERTSVGIYETADRGAYWRRGPLVELKGEIGAGNGFPAATVLGPDAVLVADPGSPKVTVLRPGGGAGSRRTFKPHGLGGPGLSFPEFADRRHGIAVLNEERCVRTTGCDLEDNLYWTADGGRSWRRRGRP
jgi:hypothetical protein